MNEQSQDASKPSVVWPRLLVTVLVLCAVAGVAYVIGSRQTPNEEIAERSLKVLGLASPIENRLNERYTDADNDLVADAPADEADWLNPDRLTFSYIATEEPERYGEVFDALIQHLAEATGKPVDYVAYDSREDQLKALANGELHIVGLNTGSVPIAVNASGFVPVASPGVGEQPLKYTMQIIVPQGSDLQSIEDLRGRTLTLTQATSNSGYKAPLVILYRDFDLTPNIDVLLNLSFGHDVSIAGIASGEYEAAAVASDLVERAVSREEIGESDFRVIYESESFPTAGLGYAHNLHPDVARQVREALLDFDWSGTAVETEFAGSGADGFASISFKDDWALIRRIDDAVNFRHELPE